MKAAFYDRNDGGFSSTGVEYAVFLMLQMITYRKISSINNNVDKLRAKLIEENKLHSRR